MNDHLRGGLIGKGLKLFRDIQKLEISIHAAHACYFIILSIFPTLVLMLGLLRYTPLHPADLMDFAGEFLPAALRSSAWNLIAGAYENTTRMVVSVAAVAALWSAGKGIYGLMKGLNAIYGVEDGRGWLRTRLVCAVYMILFILVLMLTLVLHVFGSTLVEFLKYRGGKAAWLGEDLAGLRYFLLVAAQTLLFSVMFMYLPGRNNSFWHSLPGALFGSFGWMTASGLFSVYVEKFSGYANIFGSVYAVALAMLWLYVCVSIVFYGGVLNRILIKSQK